MTTMSHKDYPWRRRRRWLLLAALGFAGMASLFLAALNWRGESAVEQLIAAIRAKGEPVTTAEIKERYPAPLKEEDASETYGKAGKDVGTSMNGDDYTDRLGKIGGTPLQERFAAELHQWMEDYLAEHAEALRLVHEAAKRPAVRYNLDLGEGYDATLPNFGELIGLSRLLQMEAFVAAENGDGARAAEAILAALAMDRSMRPGPVIIMQLVRLANQSITCAAIERVLPLVEFSGEQLAQIQRALAETWDPQAMTNALITERAGGLQAFDHPQQVLPAIQDADQWLPGASTIAAGLMRMAAVANGDRARYLELMTGVIEASRLPAYEALPVMERMSFTPSREWTLLPSLTDIIMPDMLYYETRYASGEAYLSCAQAALAAERYQLANGRPPENIEALTPAFLDAVPTDPFDGKPIRYISDEQGCRFYSIGENRLDDHGANNQRNDGGGDIVIRVDHSG